MKRAHCHKSARSNLGFRRPRGALERIFILCLTLRVTVGHFRFGWIEVEGGSTPILPSPMIQRTIQVTDRTEPENVVSPERGLDLARKRVEDESASMK